MFIPFQTDFTPDAPLYGGGAVSFSSSGPQNVINTAPDLYAPFLAFAAVTTSNGLGGTPLGLFSFLASNGTYYTFGGYSTHIKRVNGTDWEDVSRTSGGAYATASGDRWNFAAFGNRVIAVNYTDATQTYLAGTDTDFAALAGSPPKAKYVTIAGDFVVLAYVNDGTVYPHRVQWSAQGDPTASWASSATTQADYDDLDSNNGAIMGIVGDAEGFYVLQERAITRYDYVGSPIVFTANEVLPGIGALMPSSIVRSESGSFFSSKDGIKRLVGAQITPVGIGRVDKAFSSTIASTQRHLLTAFADPNYTVVHFAVPFSGDQLYVFAYNYVTDKWSLTVLEDRFNCLGIIYNSTYPNGVIAGFLDSDNKLGTFSGTAYDASFYTKIFPISKTGGKGTIDRFQVVSEVAAPEYVAVRTFSGETLGSSSDAAATAVGNNNQYTIRTPAAIAHQITVTKSVWSAGYKMLGVNILEMSEDFGR